MIVSNALIPNEDEESVIRSAYDAIFESFKKEIGILPLSEGKSDDNLVYIITDDFSDKDDSNTVKILKTAKSLVRNRKNILIVNTSERLGGHKVPIHNAFASKYNKDLENSDKVYFENMVFPYFQLPDGMPEVSYYGAFLDSLSHKKPGKIYDLSRYNMLSDICGEVLNIPVEKSI